MNLYTDIDFRAAARAVRRGWMMMLAVLVPLLAVYVLALVKGWYGPGLAVMLLGLIWGLTVGDIILLPALRYARFLQQMNAGLRRSLDCSLDCLADEIQMQDGVCVRSLQVALPDGGSRIFYVNTSKLNLLPGMGSHVRLESYGRHVLAWQAEKG